MVIAPWRPLHGSEPTTSFGIRPFHPSVPQNQPFRERKARRRDVDHAKKKPPGVKPGG
jgi:hypothetical protein